MPFLNLLGIILIITVLLIIVRTQRGEIAILLAIAAAAIILIQLLKYVAEIFWAFETMLARAEIKTEYFQVILKIIGIAYLAGFGGQICRDAGESGMAAKVELAGKITILGLGLPIMAGLLDLILKVF